MKKKNIFIIIVLICTLFKASPVNAAPDEGLNFVVNIIHPENQTKKDINYFDILVKPKEKQKLELEITNTGDTEEKIRITPTNAVTSTNGSLDYSIKSSKYKYDDTLKIPFTSLISKEQEIKIEPKKTEKVSFDLNSPDKEFNGIILGGFVISTVDNDKKEQTNEKVTFINKFQMIKAVVLRNSETEETESNIKLNTVKPALYNYRTAVTANIQNTSPFLLKNVQVTANIYKDNSNKPLKSGKRGDIELAPNSNFDFPIMWDNEPLEPGKYKAKISVVTTDKKFSFDKDFKISKEASYRINSEAIDLESSSNDNFLLIVLIIICLLLVSLLVFFYYKYLKNQTKKKKGKKGKKGKKRLSK